jgi:hypothetical protein
VQALDDANKTSRALPCEQSECGGMRRRHARATDEYAAFAECWASELGSDWSTSVCPLARARVRARRPARALAA